MREEKLLELLGEMSLEEKIGQMVQLTGDFFEAGSVITGPAAKLGLSEENVRLAGSVLGIAGAKRLKRIQKAYMERHPHGIPLLFMADVINGFRTVFPVPLAMGATFSPKLAKEASAAAAREATAAGLHVTFSPMADLVRDARWGRVMESTGEDPYLNGRFAAALVEGYRENGLSACVKHFAGYGAPVAGREYNHAELSMQTLREFHFPAYEAAVRAGCELVMPAFNTLNGVPCTSDHWLLSDVLKGEMGFDGVVISDWNAVGELTGHRTAKDLRQAAEEAVLAGVDIDMMSMAYAVYLKDLVLSGRVPEERIDQAAFKVLRLKNSKGLFEHPWPDSEEKESAVFLCGPHRKLAVRMAEESAVLLKNDGLLPLSNPSKTVAFIGPYLDSPDTYGAWAVFQDRNDTVTVSQAVRQSGHFPNALFAKGCDMLENATVYGFGKREVFGFDEKRRETLFREAEEMAAKADAAVLFLGEHMLQSGEAASRGEIGIPDVQLELFSRVRAVNKNTAVVVFSGRPLDLRQVSAGAKALLAVFMPGTMGGTAIVHLLSGEAAPSGRLPMSFPYSVGQVPVFYNETSTGRPYEKNGTEPKFVSKYIDIPNEPLYPFGYGLSYTEFSYSPMRLKETAPNEFLAEATVTNTGAVGAKEVVQLYIRDEAASTTRPVRELKGFEKIWLEPGESRTVGFSITPDMLRICDRDGQFRWEPGAFTAYIGHDSRTENGAEFCLR